jgi:predicted O-methyltransferase YrrM
MNEVFYDSKQQHFNFIEIQRKKWITSNEKIQRKDFGAGSRTGTSITISSVASSSLQPPKYARFLYRLAVFLKSHQALELGTSLGTTTAYLALSSSLKKITTIEGDDVLFEKSNSIFLSASLNNVESLHGRFEDLLPVICTKEAYWDFIYIDGNHRKEPTLNYFNLLINHTHENTVMILDDIHWSEEMWSAWSTIIADDRITLSFDIFKMGVVFFKPELSKQHFILKY